MIPDANGYIEIIALVKVPKVVIDDGPAAVNSWLDFKASNLDIRLPEHNSAGLFIGVSA